MVKQLQQHRDDGKDLSSDWINGFSEDFKKRFLQFLSFEFRDVDV